MRLTDKNGFTLIELLVVVAIIGILAAIAIPMYSNYRDSAFRAAAKTTLVEAAQTMERHFVRNSTYVGAVIPAQTESGRYDIAVVSDAVSFTITAQTNFADKCGDLTINQAGTRQSVSCDVW